MMDHPTLTRCVSVVGSLHSGKTSFVDILVQTVRDTRTQKERDALLKVSRRSSSVVNVSGPNADSPWDGFKQERGRKILTKYTDTRLDERERGISLKSLPLSYIMGDSRGKSHLVNIIDTPGHVNFRDEVLVANQICDGCFIVVDCVMGVSEDLKRQLKSMLGPEGFLPSSLILVLSQLDRMVLELRLPPQDAYLKLRHIVEELNACIGIPDHFNPSEGNVLFASGLFKFCFSLSSFAKDMYGETDEKFASCLWGDFYSIEHEGRMGFTQERNGARTFVEYVLEPMYKIIGYSVSEEKPSLSVFLAEIGVYLPWHVYSMDTKDVLEKVLAILFGGSAAIIDSICEFVPNPLIGGLGKIGRYFTGDQPVTVSAASPLSVWAVKSVHLPDCSSFDVLARVMSGTLIEGQQVRLVGETEEESEIVTVESLFIPGGRYLVPCERVPAGNWVLIRGAFSRAGTMVSTDNENEGVYRTPFFQNRMVKIACEPLLPVELPKMVEGLRRLARAYPGVSTRVEESGEHVVMGSGELYLDCCLHDLRKLYGDLEVKLSEPTVVFNETVSETSQYVCSAATPNKSNSVSMLAEPLNETSILAGEEYRMDGDHLVSREEFFLSKKYRKQKTSLLIDSCGWDALAARSLWAFGPTWDNGSSVLLNDVLPDRVGKSDLEEIRESVVQGFQWATKEGPLVEEMVRGVKLKLMDVYLNSNEIYRGSGQIIPATCRAIYGSILTGTPKLMEPILLTEIDCLPDNVSQIFAVLSKRRGHVLKDYPKPGTPFTTVLAYLPAIESFGFETTVRLHTGGQAFGMSWFDHWAIVPGDPLDQHAPLPAPLEPASHQYLARDFLLKTRRRKGLPEQVLLEKYIDDIHAMGLVREGEVVEEEPSYY